jgi:hypothetical protein
MKLVHPIRSFVPAMALVPVALVSGCDLLGIPQEVEIPIPLDTPPVDIDIGEAVDAALSEACPTDDAESCQGISLICQADNGGTPCSPVELPADFPQRVPTLQGETVPADDLLPQGVKDAAALKFAVPVDLEESLADSGVQSADQVEQISFKAVKVAWDENTLTFDVPVLDVYVGPFVDDVSKPEELIASSDFKLVGTVGKNTDDDQEGFEVGQEAGVADEVPLTFVEGGNDTFNEALRTFSFTLVFAAPDDQTLTLKEVEGSSPVEVARPDGKAKIRIKSELSFKVNFADALTGGDG